MFAVKAQPYQALQATERKLASKPSQTKPDDAAEKLAASKAAEKAAEQASRGTTNAQGQKLGQRLNISA